MFLEQTIMVDPPQSQRHQYAKYTVNKLCKKMRDKAGFTGLETYMLAKHGTIITTRAGVKIKFQIILEDEKHEFTGREYDFTDSGTISEPTAAPGSDEVHA